MQKKVFLLVSAVAIFSTILLFQNCGSSYQSQSSQLSSLSPGGNTVAPVLVKTDTHQCSFNSFDPVAPFYIRQDPFNSQQNIIYYYGRPMYGVPSQNIQQSGARLITPKAIYCGSQLVVEIDVDEVVEVLSANIVLLHKSKRVLSNCGTLDELDYNLVQQNRAQIPQMNFEQIRAVYSVYKGAIDTSHYTDLKNGYNLSDGNIYFGTYQVVGADAPSFRSLDIPKFSIAQDNQYTYFRYMRVDAPVIGLPRPLIATITDESMSVSDQRWFDNQSIFYKHKRLGRSAGFVNLGEDWSLVEGEVFYFDRKLPPVDMTSFKVIPKTQFGYDRNNLYFGEKIVQLPQGESWSPQHLYVVGERVLFKNYVIHTNTKMTLLSSRNSLRCIGTNYMTDGTKLIDSMGVDVTAQFPGADLNNLYNLSSGLGFYDKQNYFSQNGQALRITNPSSFRVLNRYYFAADGRVYNDARVALPGSEQSYVWVGHETVASSSQIYSRGQTTAIAFTNTKSPKYIGLGYHLGDTQVMYNGIRTIDNIDVTTFKILSSTVSFDKNSIYASGQLLMPNNSGNLRLLHRNIWALDEAVYQGRTTLAGATASTLMSVNPNTSFYITPAGVYYSSQRVSTDVAGFRWLGSSYWKDSARFWHATQAVLLNTYNAKVIGPFMTLLDGGADSLIYHYGVRVNSAVSGNIQYLDSYNSAFWTDHQTVYANQNPIPGVSPNQISFLPDGTATDGNRCFNTTGAVIACP